MSGTEITISIESASGDSEILRCLVQRADEPDQAFFERAQIVLWEAFHRAGLKVAAP